MIQLEKLYASHAHGNFNNWLKKGTPFSTIAPNSLNKTNGSEIAQLQEAIETHASAAGYIEQMIAMGKVKEAKARRNPKGPEVIEMEVMGSAPLLETSKL